MSHREQYQHVLELQERVVREMKRLEAEGEVPSALEHAKEKAIAWAEAVEKEDGNDKSYREWPPKQFAHELKKNINLFGNHEGTQFVREYEQAVGKIKYNADHEEV